MCPSSRTLHKEVEHHPGMIKGRSAVKTKMGGATPRQEMQVDGASPML